MIVDIKVIILSSKPRAQSATRVNARQNKKIVKITFSVNKHIFQTILRISYQKCAHMNICA